MSDKKAQQAAEAARSENPSGPSNPPAGNVAHVDWEQRYKNQSKVLSQRDVQIQKLNEEIEEYKAEISKLNTTHEMERLSWEDERNVHDKSIHDIETMMKAREQEIEMLRSDLTKHHMLAEHPELLPFAGAIQPTQNEEDLRRQIDALKKGTENYRRTVVKDLRRETIPPAAAVNPGEMSVEELRKLAQSKIGKPDFQRYWDEYMRVSRMNQ